MKKCIINVSFGGWYPTGQERLALSLDRFGNGIDRLFWKDEFPPKSPDHSLVPFAFKAYAFMEAKNMGYDVILWLDSAICAIKDVGPIFSHIEKNGYLFLANSYIGYFCSDKCLEHFKIDRQEAFAMREIMGCCFGLNLKDSKSQEFLQAYFDHSNDGITFVGSGTNRNKEVSANPLVKGHRHDQTVASILVHKIGMTDFLIAHETFLCYKDQIPYYFPNSKEPDSVIFYSDGL